MILLLKKMLAGPGSTKMSCWGHSECSCFPWETAGKQLRMLHCGLIYIYEKQRSINTNTPNTFSFWAFGSLEKIRDPGKPDILR